MIFRIAIESLKNRKGAVLLTMLSIIVSVSLLISVDNIRKQAKDSFGRTVSGVDLIVGARTGQVNLLLYSVFRMGNPGNSIQWSSYEEIANATAVKWAVPVSLGDSHRGFRVMGTSQEYFKRFQYGQQQSLSFQSGATFNNPFGAVIGADIAEALNYSIDEEIVLSHGVGHTSFSHHKHSPFKIVGILKPTGTPVDKTVHVSLAGVEVAHMREALVDEIADKVANNIAVDVQVKNISAIFLGLNSKVQALQMQHSINQYQQEALMAILPGVALAELWQLVGTLENVLLLISVLILVSSLLGMATMLLTSIRERQREFAVLRAIGAGPLTLFTLIQVEAFVISLIASILGVVIVWSILTIGNDWLSHEYGLFIDNKVLSVDSFIIVSVICAASFLIASIPAFAAYTRTLQQGLTAK